MLQSSNMPISVVARFVDAFIGGFWKTMKDRLIDGGLLVGGLLYWLFSGKLSAHFWDSITPWIWVLCLIVVWHTIRAARLLWREIAQGSPRQASVILSQYGKPLELQTAAIPKYRLQIICLAGAVVMMSIGCAYLSWKMAHVLGAEDSRVPRQQEETLFATVEMAVASFGPPAVLTGFWHIHSMNDQLCTITPIDILAFIRIESTSSWKATIAGYTLEAGDQKSGKWTLLKKVPMTYGAVVFTGKRPANPQVGNVLNFPATSHHVYGMALPPQEADYQHAALVGLNILDTQLSQPIMEHSPVRGWAAFQGQFQGDWRITAIDSLNRSHQFVVPQVLTDDQSDVMLRLLKIAGVTDVSRCEKR
jgi:hypothetical protein